MRQLLNPISLRWTWPLVVLVLLFATSCSRQYGAYFMRNAGGGGLMAGTKQVALPDSTIAKINQANLLLLAKRQIGPLTSSEHDSLKYGLLRLAGHVAAGGNLDKPTKRSYQSLLMAQPIRPTSNQTESANRWDLVAADLKVHPADLSGSSWSSYREIGHSWQETRDDEYLGPTEGKAMSQLLNADPDPDDVYIEQLVAALLCVFVGFTGAHRFYLGYPKQGYIQLAWFVGSLLTYLLFYLLIQNAQRSGLDSWAVLGYVVFALLVLAVILIPLLIWIFVDLVRILAGNLRKRPWPTPPLPTN